MTAPEKRDAETILARAWPKGTPEGEVAFLGSLAIDRRDMVLRRLEAVLDAADGSRTVIDAGRVAGVGRTMFFNLRRRWEDARSLRALSPFEPDRKVERVAVAPGARRGLWPRRQAIERHAAMEEIRAAPAASNERIATRVVALTGSRLDRRTIAKLVREERRLMHFEPTLLIGVYGRSLLADVTALDLRVRDGELEQYLVAAFIVETSSTLILGHAAGLAESGIDLQRIAAARAREFLRRERADVSADTVVKMMVVVGPGPAGETEDLLRRAARSIPADLVDWNLSGRFGGRLAALIGQPGRYALRAAATATGNIDGPPSGSAVTLAQAEMLLAGEIERHNRSAVDALRHVGLIGAGEADGAMGRLLSAAFDAIP